MYKMVYEVIRNIDPNHVQVINVHEERNISIEYLNHFLNIKRSHAVELGLDVRLVSIIPV